MKRTVCLLAGFILLSHGVLFGALSRQIVAYDIKARLFPDTKTVKASELLTWTNDSAAPVSELQFHLYMNAFKNNRTTFMKESGGSHRGFKIHHGQKDRRRRRTRPHGVHDLHPP
jgi:hypothetical protein